MSFEIIFKEGHLFITHSGKDWVFPFKWFIFGSSTSLDLDVAFDIPSEIWDSFPHVSYLYKLTRFFDLNFLALVTGPIYFKGELIEVESFKTLVKNKEINSTLISIGPNDYLIKNLKGPIDESNNGLVLTHDYHPQMFLKSPIRFSKMRLVSHKCVVYLTDIIRALRLESIDLLEKREDFFREHIKKTCYYLKQDQTDQLKKKAKRYFHNIFYDMSVNKNKPKNPFINRKVQKSYMVRIEEAIINKTSDEEINQIVDERLVHEFNPNDPYKTKTLKFKAVIYMVNKVYPIGEIINLLSTLDFCNLNFSEPSKLPDLMKKVAFQLGQVAALLEGFEAFQKEELCERYPELTPFLRRESYGPEDLLALNKLIRQTNQQILERCDQEGWILKKKMWVSDFFSLVNKIEKSDWFNYREEI